MDQLKVFWGYIVKYHFWILTSLVLLASLIVFSLASSSLNQQVMARHSKLDSDFSTVSRLETSAPEHPNANTEAVLNKAIEQTKQNVVNAWATQYKQQVPILIWPTKIFDTNSSPLRIVESFRPIERLEPTIPKDPMTTTDRSVYRDYLKGEFSELAKIVGAIWTAELGGGTSGDSVDASGSIVGEPVVKWENASQAKLQKDMAEWWGPTSVPSTLDILYTQESIWILKAILEVIKNTNGQVRENFQASVKEIEWIRLGKEANDQSLLNVVAGKPLGLDDVIPTDSTFVDPADDRYVDVLMKPMKGAMLREKMKSSAPDDAPYAVAKRIPIRFRVKMDQSKIPTMVSLCGNGSIMIEVKQVRVNSGDAPLMVDLAPISTGEGDGEDGGSPVVSFQASAANTGGPAAISEGGDTDSTGVMNDDAPIDSPVEVFGIVYLFNPPDKQKLGMTDPASASPAGSQ
jgi:hypothetical protein